MLKHSAGTVAESQFVTYAETQFCHICRNTVLLNMLKHSVGTDAETQCWKLC
jgi:hypothetical protein